MNEWMNDEYGTVPYISFLTLSSNFQYKLARQMCCKDIVVYVKSKGTPMKSEVNSPIGR